MGSVAGMVSPTFFTSWQFWMGLAAWMLPANVFLYGVNDLADYDTDQFNDKKKTHETVVTEHDVESRRLLMVAVVVSAIVLAGWAATVNLLVLVVTLLFLGLGAGYSLPPVRFKARAVLDSYSNVLYALPGLVGFLAALHWGGDLLANTTYVILAMIAAGSFSVAMHAFSAAPDIKPDRLAGITTIAGQLGYRLTLWFCILHWLLSLAIGWWLVGPVAVALVPHLVVTGWLLTQPESRIHQAYWWLPYLNALAGAALFWSILLSKMPLSCLFS